MTNKSYLLDTVAAVALLNGDPGMDKILDEESDLFLSVVTLGELYFGAEKSVRVEENRRKVDVIAQRYEVHYLDNATARLYGQITRSLRAKGRPIPQNDVWIAAVAVQHKLTLLTRDEHFKEVDNLPLASW